MSDIIGDSSFVGIFLSVAGPTLDDITESTCPNGTYHKCLPYGDCYDAQSYCSDKSRSVNSCFPDKIVGNNKNLLVWCIERTTNNITRMPHPSCKLACVDKFGIAALYQRPTCQNENSADYTWVLWAFLVVAIVLIASIILNIVLLVQRYKAPRRQDATTADAETQDGNNQIPRNDSKDSVKDETEPAAPPAMAALDTDLNVNQPALNHRNAPLNVQLHSVHDSRATNTQNTAPMDQLDSAQGRSTNTQNPAPMDQLDSAQGRSTNTQNTAPMILTHNDQDTIDFQGGQAIYSPQARDPVASFSSAYFRPDIDDTSEESLALIPRNQATESGDDTAPIRTQVDLYIHTSTTIPEAEGRHPVVTNVATYE